MLCVGGHIDHADDIELGAQKSLVADGLAGLRFGLPTSLQGLQRQQLVVSDHRSPSWHTETAYPHPLVQLAETQLSARLGLENHATDASKSVDADLHRHCNFDNGTRVRGCTSKNGALQPHEMCEQGLPLP